MEMKKRRPATAASPAFRLYSWHIGPYSAFLYSSPAPILWCAPATRLRGIPGSGNECVPADIVPFLHHASGFLLQ